LRSFSHFAFFARRFRVFRKNIFPPAGHLFSSHFAVDECTRAIAHARERRAMPKSIVVQNVASTFGFLLIEKGLQAASSLGLREVGRDGFCSTALFRRIGV